MTLEIRYNFGRGRLRLKLPEMLDGINAHDFGVILETIRTAENMEECIKVLHEYIADVFTSLSEERAYCSDAKSKARYTTKIKKYLSMNAAMLKRFDVPVLSDEAAHVRCKKCDVYAQIVYNGKPSITVFSGYSFEKYGRTFHVYKRKCGRSSVFIVIWPSVGMQCVPSASSKNEAIESITEEWIAKIESLDLSNQRTTFEDLMRQAGYEHVLEEAVHSVKDAPAAAVQCHENAADSRKSHPIQGNNDSSKAEESHPVSASNLKMRAAILRNLFGITAPAYSPDRQIVRPSGSFCRPTASKNIGNSPASPTGLHRLSGCHILTRMTKAGYLPFFMRIVNGPEYMDSS